MKTNIQLSFNGQCEEAFKFYEKNLGGKISFMMTWGQSPMGAKMPKEMAKKIIHGTIVIGDMEVGGGDAPPDMYRKPQGIHACLNIDAPAEAEKVFAKLAEGGTTTMQLEETFWAKRFGMCVDKFGIPWMVNCGKPMPVGK